MLTIRRWLVSALVTMLALGAASAPGADREDWYVVELQGQRTGWMREHQRLTERGWESGMEMHLSFGRGGQRATAGVETTFLETVDHEPIEMTMTQRLGNTPVTSRFVFTEDGITLTTVNAGQEFTQTMPRPEGEWMTPVEAYEHIAERLAAGAEEIRVRMVSPLVGPAPIESVMFVEERENIEAFGRIVPALRARVETSLTPGERTVQWTDLEGRAVRTEQSMGAMSLTVIAADQQLALAEPDAPEIMTATFVKPTGAAIEDPRLATRAEYVLSAGGGEIPALSSGAQEAERLEDGRVRVRLDLSRVDDDPSGPEHLESSSMIAADDAVVVQLRDRALEGVQETPVDRALALRRFVYEFVEEKSLGVGFASASEVARTAAGDCTEHAVLLAALLRSAGIPSRVVSGLVYTQAFAGAQDVFGYHAWTQARLDGRWVDLDPTLPGPAPFDAAHIALSVTPMRDGMLVNSLMELGSIMGRLEIETVRIR